MNSVNNKLRRNTISSLLYQIVAIICGFVLPRLILKQYGSDVNGLVNSINQFLSIISFLELGVGAVVKSALYKPCALKDYKTVSEIYRSAQKFFNKIALILFVYVCSLLIIFPGLINHNYSWLFIDSLIVSISVTSFAEYYFGMVNSLLLQADQKNAVQFDIRTVTLVINTIICCVLITLNLSIQVVKIVTSLVFLVRPMFLNWYVNKNYKIDRKIQYSVEPIKQKWNGIAQHVASVVLTQTDTIVLTIFTDFKSVSVYSVYYMPVVAIEQLILYTTNGYESHIGSLWAKGSPDDISKSHNRFIWLLHLVSIVLYGVAASSISSFVRVYTRGVNDADYIRPMFGYVLILAYTLFCFRLPSTILIKAAGHYKQTQNTFIVATLINLIISILFVKRFGLIGVAVGTLCSMLYHSIRLSIYTSKHLIHRKWIDSFKQITVDIIIVAFAFVLSSLIKFSVTNYIQWVLVALLNTFIWASICIVVNFFAYKSEMMSLIRKFVRI